MSEVIRSALGRRNLIVVAHPDDEVLWCGGLPLSFPDREWIVVACSPPFYEPLRMRDFFDAVYELGARGIVLPYAHGANDEVPIAGLDAIRLEELKPDCLVTHGEHGEYGHLHHKQVHQYVVEHFKGPVLTFGWWKGGEGEHVLELPPEVVGKKNAALDRYRSYGTAQSLRSAYLVREKVPFNRETYDLV